MSPPPNSETKRERPPERTRQATGVARLGYGVLAGLVTAAARIAPDGSSKLLRSLRARRGLEERLERWGREGRDDSRPLLWIHAPSVGEGLQARPVIELVRAEYPDIQIAYTHFSPSAEALARELPVDVYDYLPFDSAKSMRRAIAALRPSAIVFSKLDVWPVMVREASLRGIPLGIISATLSSESGRSRPLIASLLRDAYSRLEFVGAIDQSDASRLLELGVDERAVRITGDTRYDQVWERVDRVDRGSALLGPLCSERLTLVAGSTWPSDEVALLEVWSAFKSAIPAARLIIAPHEPTSTHLAPIESWARNAGLRAALLSDQQTDSGWDVLLVDQVGVLGELYTVGNIAFVGGGFHAAGLHSVLEPAAAGIPVLFGPRHTGSRDAELLLRAGGAIACGDAATLRAAIESYATDHELRSRAGAAAREVVRKGLGAAEKSAKLVIELMRRRSVAA